MKNIGKAVFFYGLISWFLIFPLSVQAENSTFSGYGETGKSSTADDYDEEDTDDKYNYQNYHLKIAQDVSERLAYDIGSFIYSKDYKSGDLSDSHSRIFKVNGAYYLKRLKGESMRADLKLQYKEKRYDNNSANEYDRISVAPALTLKKELYTAGLSFGIDNYDYLAASQNDELRYFSRVGVERYFLDKRLLLASSYKAESAEHKKADRERVKHEIMAGFDYLFDLPWFYKPAGSGLASDNQSHKPAGSGLASDSQSHKISCRANWGKKDTKEDDERDDDYDYEYWHYSAQSEHRLNEKLKTALKYRYFQKDYLITDLDHRGFAAENSWDLETFDDEAKRLWFEFNTGYKDTDYCLKNNNDYQRHNFGIEANYQRKNDWKASAGFSANFYDFNDSANNKERYYARMAIEKLFINHDLTLGLDFKHRYTDYSAKDNSEEDTVRVSFNCKL